MKHETIRIGIMPLDQFKKRTIAIAKGQYKPKKDEPKIWFRSMKALTEALSEKRRRLFKLILKA